MKGSGANWYDIIILQLLSCYTNDHVPIATKVLLSRHVYYREAFVIHHYWLPSSLLPCASSRLLSWLSSSSSTTSGFEGVNSSSPLLIHFHMIRSRGLLRDPNPACWEMFFGSDFLFLLWTLLPSEAPESSLAMLPCGKSKQKQSKPWSLLSLLPYPSL